MLRRSGRGLAALVALAALLVAAPGAVAAENIREDEQLGFAQALLAEGDFFRAITELKRFLHIFPGSPRSAEVRLSIAGAYLAAGRAEEAAAEYAALGEAEPEGPLAGQATLGLALALLSQGRREAGRELLRGLARRAQGPLRGRAALELALSLAEEGQWAKAREELQAVSAPGPQLEWRLNALAQAEGESKSPPLAGLLSALLPGAGQAYCGRWRDGALALLINGLFIGGTVEAGVRQNWELAAGLGLVELLWYGGTIYGAVNCAHRHEAAQAERARKVMERGPEAGRRWVFAWGGRF